MSIEKEVFPQMAADGQIHSMDLPGFWMDVGQPKDFLIGTGLWLTSVSKKNPSTLSTGPQFAGHVLVHPTARIGENCKIGPHVVIGPNVVIGDGVRMQRSVILDGAVVKDHAWVNSTIVGWHSTIGRWARLENVSVLGDDVHIADEVISVISEHPSPNATFFSSFRYMLTEVESFLINPFLKTFLIPRLSCERQVRNRLLNNITLFYICV